MVMIKRKLLISVIGGHENNTKVGQLAHKIGIIIAKIGGIVVCGGLYGAMEAVCRGAKEAKGTTIGLIPGTDKKDANEYVDIVIPTTIGYARNVMVACCADIIIALPGSHGTLSEICYGFVYDKPIIDMGGWKRKGMIKVNGLKGLEAKLKILIREMDFKNNA